MKISIIVPCYNEEASLVFFYDELARTLKTIKLENEIIFVNDGSKDNTLRVLLDLKEKNTSIHVLDFSRNFGKEAGILAGLRYATGDYVVLMDADLQDPPYLLPEMMDYVLNKGYDSVATYRVDRKGEPPIRSYFARQFYRIINSMSKIEIVDGARDYRLMSRTMVDAILSLSEYHRFSKGIFAWVGFETYYLPFENVERIAGESKWNFWSLLKYAIEGLVAFTTVPLRLATVSGFILSLATLGYMIYVIVKALLFGDPVAGYPSMVTIILFLGSVQLMGLGIIGEYMSKMYMEIKKRPHYIIKEIYKEKD